MPKKLHISSSSYPVYPAHKKLWSVGREEQRQLIPIEESAVKKSLGSRKFFKTRETYNLQIEQIEKTFSYI